MLNKSHKIKIIMPCSALILMLFFIANVVASQPIHIELEVNYDNSTPVNLNKYGVNGALLGSKMSYGSDKLVNAYNTVGIPFTRFPGGTIGNYYNWSTGGFSCNKEPDEKANKRIDRMNRTLKRTGGTYSVDDFFHFVKATDTEFTYMLNILCESVENNRKLLKYMKAEDVGLNFIELGNEIYSNNYSWRYKDAYDYINVAEETYKVVKEIYPEAKVGLVVSPISYSGNANPDPNGEPNRSWPKKLRDYDHLAAKSVISDALIIHIYGYPYNNKWSESDPVTFEEHFLKVMEHFNHKFDKSMQYLHALASDKPVWITEWGVSAPTNKRKGLFSKYTKSAFHALYVSSVLSSIALENNVEVANYHIIRDLWKSTKKGYEITDVGRALKMFIESSLNSDKVYEVSVKSNISGIKTLMFKTNTGEEMFVINENNESYIIDKIITEVDTNDYNIETLSIDNDVFITNQFRYKSKLNSTYIEIKPYSISRVKYDDKINNLN